MTWLSHVGCIILSHDWFFPPQVNEIDFQDSIMVLGFSEELNKELLTVSQQSRVMMKLLFPFLLTYLSVCLSVCLSIC